jgi:hypothetical protein
MEYETACFQDNAGGHDWNRNGHDTAHEHQPVG